MIQEILEVVNKEEDYEEIEIIGEDFIEPQEYDEETEEEII